MAAKDIDLDRRIFMELYIIRHGETYWNHEHRIQGRSDLPLNENGRALAGKTGEALEQTPFDVIYSSPLIRAYETANLIRGHRNIQIIRDDRLQEISFGISEGEPLPALTEDPASPFHYFFDRPELYTAPDGGESLEHICARASDFLKNEIEPREKDFSRVMIVAHAALNKALLCHIMQHGIKDFWSDGRLLNCSACIFRLENGHYEMLAYGKTFN